MTQTTLDDLIASIEAATDRDDLWRRTVPLLTGQGAVTLCYHHYPRPAAVFAEPFIAQHGWPLELERRYRDDGLWRIDPIHRLARRSIGVVTWAEARACADVGPAEAELVAEVEASSLRGGIAFQLFGPRLRTGVIAVGLDVSVPKFPTKALARLQIIAQAYHLRLCALTPDDDGPTAHLSPRERDIIDLIVIGASNKAIARHLGVSPHTVDTLVRRLFGKLGVSDRTSAAIYAVGSGLVLPRTERLTAPVAKGA